MAFLKLAFWCVVVGVLARGDDDDDRDDYEVWGSDQSNSAAGVAANGVVGGFAWIWDKEGIERQLSGGPAAVPLPCTPDATQGPCNLLDIFPSTLEQFNEDGNPTSATLGSLGKFGRVHGLVRDPFGLYLTANMFVAEGAFVGIIDAQTKEAVGLFRVTKLSYTGVSVSRSVHMSTWTADGSAILVANLHGKTVERIDVDRNRKGKITNLSFNIGASIGFGKGMAVVEPASYFVGENAFGRQLLGQVSGDYDDADFQDFTPNGVCKENGCTGPAASAGGRANNVVICPIAGPGKNAYVTFGGGGLIILDTSTTPMTIVGEYGQNVVYGAGCGGSSIGNQVYINAGVSASGAGATQSMFALFEFDDSMYDNAESNLENTPMPIRVFQDAGNTLSGGNVEGDKASDNSGQKPGVTTRRDSHGTSITENGRYVHVVDRIQNVIEVFNTQTLERTTYDLVSRDGQSGRQGPAGACFAKSVLDDSQLPLNDPAPDLMESTPDGKYQMVAFRGPAPVSVGHAAQGSCPGVGVVELLEDGKYGRLVTVLRASNTLDDNTNGVTYAGVERSDVHGVDVISKANW